MVVYNILNQAEIQSMKGHLHMPPQTIDIVICCSHFGFKLQPSTIEAYCKQKAIPGIGHIEHCLNINDIKRDDPLLVTLVRTMEKDNKRLKVVTIPADIDWRINDYDGAEWVEESHRVWR